MSYYSTGYINSNNDMNVTGFSGYSYLFIDCSGGSISVKLPTAANGQSYKFTRIDSKFLTTCTFTCQTGDTINGVSNLLFPLNNSVETIYYNNRWYFPRLTVSL